VLKKGIFWNGVLKKKETFCLQVLEKETFLLRGIGENKNFRSLGAAKNLCNFLDVL
jgi:hypothetical protein